MIALQIFNHKKFGKIRVVVVIDGVAWYVAKDVLEALGVEWKGVLNIVAIPRRMEGVRCFRAPVNSSKVVTSSKMWCMTQEGLFLFLSRCKKPAAKP